MAADSAVGSVAMVGAIVDPIVRAVMFSLSRFVLFVVFAADDYWCW